MTTKDFTIKYFTKFGEPTSKMECENVEEYYVQFWEKELLRIEEYYKNNVITSISYYLDAGEQTSEYLNFKKVKAVTLYRNPVYHFHYKQYDVETYIDNELKNRRLQVLTKNYCSVYDKSFDVLTGNVNYFEKSCYNEEFNLTYEFEYDEKGLFKRLTIYDPENIVDTDEHTIYPKTIGVGKNDYNFDWKDFEYFQNEEPILPERSYCW